MDYLITEAVFIKAQREDADAQKKADEEAKREEWKKESQAKLKDLVN